MKVLGIDPAKRSGFYHSDGYFIAENCDRFGDQPGQSLVRFRKLLTEILQKHPTELIAAEDASFGSPNPNVQAEHNERRGIIKLVAAELTIDVKFFHPTSIKMFATGSGRADKAQMMRACKTLENLDINDPDIADAYWIMRLAARPDCWPVKKPKATKRGKVLPATKRYKRLF